MNCKQLIAIYYHNFDCCSKPSLFLIHASICSRQLILCNANKILQFTVEGLHSTLRYVPYSARNYGTVFCWARNVVAAQTDPCVFTLQPASEYPHFDIYCIDHIYD